MLTRESATDLTIEHLRKEFPSHDGTSNVVAVADAQLHVEKGELVTLLGPSGCGKTTLLRMIAGFEEPTSGRILFGERDITNVAPNRRDAAMVFQSYAIFPHLNVFDNVAFGLRLKQLRASQLQERVDKVLDLTGLTGYAKRSPHQLSGGQQQRVALARCIVMEPRLLLFDEPLSNLDAKLREQMRVEIRELQQRLGITTVYVTHDQVEAMSISDRVIVMNEGHVMQVGSPTDIYAKPVNRFVADFIGKANFVEGHAVDSMHVRVNGEVLASHPHAARADQEVTVLLRPEALELTQVMGVFKGAVKRVMFLGSLLECVIEVPGLGELVVDVANPVARELPVVGEEWFVTPVEGLPAVITE